MRRVLGFLVVAVLGAALLGEQPVLAAPDPEVPAEVIAPSTSSRVADPEKNLRRGWATSADLAWTTSGDGDGFHVLSAPAREGYAWRTVATLSEPGFDVDQWIGNACVTGSGRRLVVVYAPRSFTNEGELFDRGGFVAVVDLITGAVAKLPVTGSLAYSNPGCGVGELAVISQLRSDESVAPQTRLLVVDASRATVAKPVVVAGELSSVVPVGTGLVAATGSRLVRVGRDGRISRLVESTGTPFRLTADAAGGVVFMDRLDEKVRVRRVRGAHDTGVVTLANGKLDRLGISRGAGGRVFVTGEADQLSSLPKSVFRLSAPRTAEISTLGEIALTKVAWAGQGDPRAGLGGTPSAKPLAVDAVVPATGKRVRFAVQPQSDISDSGRAPHPALAVNSKGEQSRALAGSPTSPVDAERRCSVPRNDVKNLALQPKPRQVEWAVDQAVTKSLTLTRPANWKNSGMPSYSPQGLFPPVNLAGGGRVPAQILLGIATQESNLWQASRHALPGVMSNPLIGNYYGLDIYDSSTADDWDIQWDKADCGYGVMQITDGMRLAGFQKPGETPLPYQTQRAVALDFAVNIAAGAQILQKKWNETRAAGLTVNNGDPASIENWFFAVWAYNSGFYPNRGDGSPWGVGWLNNPANPRYDPQRLPFLEYTYDDARTPQKWPYQEKVLGWAGHPINSYEAPDTLVPGFRGAWWTTVNDRIRVKPPVNLFCDLSNDCRPGQRFTPDKPDDPSTPGDDSTIGEPAGPCAHKDGNGRYDLKCWYHQPVDWKDCVSQCGNELLRFDPGYPYQADGTSYPPRCDLGGLPAGALVIDDLPDTVASMRDVAVDTPCTRKHTNAGTFALNFAADSAGNYTSKIDTHHLGAGFNGHFWFTHTHAPMASEARFGVTGTWTLGKVVNGPARVLVHMPDHGAQAKRAKYAITTAKGVRYRTVYQPGNGNRWVSLGAYQFNAAPKVTLSSTTEDGNGEDDIAFDAVAFVPISGT